VVYDPEGRISGGLIEQKHNRLVDFKAPDEEERRTVVIRPSAFATILLSLYGDFVEIIRDCLLVMSAGAFRPSEAIQLRWDWVRKDHIELPAWFHKTGKKTKKPVLKPRTKEMNECLDRRPHRTGFIFSLDGGVTHILQPTVADNFKRAAIKAGVRLETRKSKTGKERIVADVQLRDLRCSTATLLIERGAPLSKVSQLLGHTSLEQTQHYLCLQDDHCLDLGPTISEVLAPDVETKVVHLFKR
jgi:integrase